MIDALDVMMDHRIADLEPRKHLTAGKAKEIVWKGNWSEGLEPHILLEGLYMVASGIRPSSFHHPSSEREIVLLNGAAKELGLGMRVRLAGKKVYKVWLSGTDAFGMVWTLPDITEDMGPKEFVTAQITMANMTGKFLGYPECCVRSFVEHLMAGTDQDLEAKEALNKFEDPDPRAYFVERFVPCRPDCPEAIREGECIERALSKQAPDMLPDYLRLRDEHMEEVRSGAIIKEKRARDQTLIRK
ncbi:MAG: DUF483 domain-containing protein [Candidatus Thermoplasmatota archaeon]|jgi:hypothetical protein|nr:DUF483 domain-containing protein [Candidatus Thermoplasmatota archaeon]